jgi:hypothetical protein
MGLLGVHGQQIRWDDQGDAHPPRDKLRPKDDDANEHWRCGDEQQIVDRCLGVSSS